MTEQELKAKARRQRAARSRHGGPSTVSRRPEDLRRASVVVQALEVLPFIPQGHTLTSNLLLVRAGGSSHLV